MANYYFGIGIGDNDTEAVVGASPTGKAVEVIINTAVITSVSELYLSLEKLKGRLITDGKTWT